MKKLTLMGLVAVLGSAAAFAQTLAEARGKIDQAIADAAVMAEQVKGLSAADQVQFLSDVNKAISEMPASVEEKTAKFLNANSAALKSAEKGNTAALLAEVFATVPPEALTVINERFASDLMNRAADPKVTFTDDEYTNLVVNVMKTINERTEETDIPSVRSTFAILMFVRASNGTPENLVDTLVDTLKNDEARDLAKKDWIPPALGANDTPPDYEPLLGAADAGRRPDFEQVLVIAGVQFGDALLTDLLGKNFDPKAFARVHTPVLDAVQNPLIHQVPNVGDEAFSAELPAPADGNPQARRPKPVPPQPVPPRPIPYGGQIF